MVHERAAKNLFYLFITLPVIGLAQFLMALAFGPGVAAVAGGAGLAVFVTALGVMLAKGTLTAGLPRWGVAFFALAAVWIFWLSSLPPYFRDDLITHLALPALYLAKGEWAFPPFQPSAFSPDLLLPLNMTFIAAGADRFASFIPAAYMAAAALFTAHWSAREFGPRWGVYSAAALLTLPPLFRLAGTAYTDPAVMFLSGAGIYFLYLLSERWEAGDGWRAAASFGAATAIKYNAGLLMVCAVTALFFAASSGGRLKEWSKTVVVCVAAVLLFCGPWWVASRLDGVGPETPSIKAFGRGPVQERAVMCGEAPVWAAAAPVRLFFAGEEGDRCGFDGKLNPFLLLCAVAGAALAWTSVPKRALLLAPLLFIALSGFLASPMARYYLPLAPQLVFLSVSFLSGLSARKNGLPAILLASALVLFNAWGYGTAAVRFEGWGALTGRETKEEFLAKTVPGYNAMVWANGHLPAEGRVYFVFGGNRVYHIKRDYYYDAFWDGTSLMSVFMREKSPEGITAALAKMGITHLLVMKGPMQQFVGQNGLQPALDGFLAVSTVMFEDDAAALIALAPGTGL